MLAPGGPTPREGRGGTGDGGWGKEPQPTILLLCDVNVAAGGHVDFKSTHYYSGNLNRVR